MSARVQIGVAGWSYPDWRGVVYPRGCKDELRWLARYVDFIEVNTTFYRVPDPATVARWVERTLDVADFFFTAKLPREVTHRDAGVDPAIATAFGACVAPMRDAGRLRAILAQFSYRFAADPAGLAQLAAIADAFGELAPLVVELRHASWREPAAWRAAAALGFAIAQLDYPGCGTGFDGAEVEPAPRLGYFRIHGRNRAAWFRKDAGRDEVYDYEYSEAERLELGDRIRALATDGAGDLLVVANNHFQGKAVKLALELAASARETRVEVPDPLLAAYPDLRKLARGVLF